VYVSSRSESPPFRVISKGVMPHLRGLTQSYPIHSADCFRKKLCEAHRALKRALASPGVSPWPGKGTLCLLRVLGSVWSTSDMRHAVVAPARLLVGAYLALGLKRVRSVRDAGRGVFLCTVVLEYERESRRLVPEAVTFLVHAVLRIARWKEGEGDVPGLFPSLEHDRDELRLGEGDEKGVVVGKPDFVRVVEGRGDVGQNKVDLLALALDLLREFAEMYSELEGFIELFEPVEEVVERMEMDRLPKGCQVCHFSMGMIHFFNYGILKGARESTTRHGLSTVGVVERKARAASTAGAQADTDSDVRSQV
jgi:nucleolar protein 14